MITINDFQEYVVNILEGVPEYNLQNAKIYFTCYYRDFLEYYREHLFALEQIKLSRDRTGFLFNMQDYLINCARTINDFFVKYSRQIQEVGSTEIDEENEPYVIRSMELFQKAVEELDNKLENSNVLEASKFYNAGDEAIKYITEMFDKYGTREEADLLLNELTIIQKDIEAFGNTNFEKIAIQEIDNEIINSI